MTATTIYGQTQNITYGYDTDVYVHERVVDRNGIMRCPIDSYRWPCSTAILRGGRGNAGPEIVTVRLKLADRMWRGFMEKLPPDHPWVPYAPLKRT